MASKKGKIRVGLIRCDRRSLWYGAIFDHIDPNAYAELDPLNYHHLVMYSRVELRHRRAAGFRLVKVYDPDRDAAHTIAKAFRTKPHVCRNLEEVSDDVDLVFIADESTDGKDHPKLAMPGLKKGVPTFIDRPFARTVKDAQAMISLARRKRVPLLSCSHMHMLPQAAWFKSRFQEVPPIGSGMVLGRGPNPAEIADGMELALFLFGDEFGRKAERVQSMGRWPLEIASVCFSKARGKRTLHVDVISSHNSSTRNACFATAIGKRLPLHQDHMDAFAQPEGGRAVVNAIKRMIRTGEPPISYQEMIEVVALVEAGRKAHNKARPVPLKRIR